VATDGYFPFEYQFVAPRRTAQKISFRLSARASDTGGNFTFTPEIIVNLTPDVTPPSVRNSFSGLPGYHDGVSDLVVFWTEPINPGTLNTNTVRIVSVGADGIPGTGDDVDVQGVIFEYRADLNAVFLRPT